MVVAPNRCQDNSSSAMEPWDSTYRENTLISTTTSTPIHSQEARRPTAITKRSRCRDNTLVGSESVRAGGDCVPPGKLVSVTTTSNSPDAGRMAGDGQTGACHDHRPLISRTGRNPGAGNPWSARSSDVP